MNTPTHIVVALAALSRRGESAPNRAVLAGALIPDIAIYLWAPWQYLVRGRSGDDIWNTLYFEPPMQTAIALINSVPIYAALALLGWVQRGKVWGMLMLAFALAALLHIALDLPVHSGDAYRHFWPVSDWRFYSPVSYWEADKGARWVSLVEAAVVLGSVAVLWRRFPTLWVRVLLALAALFALGTALAYRLASIQVPS